ncbi:hypothetical protein BS47DRAFT_1396182 [Hydnum rufescens UP504]|uniref:Uncharacterized protein n=1 Tax=Hydnum rufescens UP504 TaxID=1448309 RepID=A0A9P6DPM6_9AGAM|nr:hypothetical protein BS47DRAFT_1396182 [Hydnum rufescens UP504]
MASIKENEKTAWDQKKWMVSNYFLHNLSPTLQEVLGFASLERVMIDLRDTEDNHDDEVGGGKLGLQASDDGATTCGLFKIISEDNPNLSKGPDSLPSPNVGRGSAGAPDEEMGVDEDLNQTPKCANNQYSSDLPMSMVSHNTSASSIASDQSPGPVPSHPKFHNHPFVTPPSVSWASEAINLLTEIIRPSCPKGPSHKDPDLDLLTQMRLEQMLQVLHLYCGDKDESGHGWISSSNTVARAWGK